ncbi:MAG: Fic family protein [Gemmataceae bacterium]
MIATLTQGERALGELKGVGRSLPNPHLLIRPYIRREAILSSRIEGTVTRLGQLLLFEAGTETAEEDSDLAEVLNYIEAVELGIAELASGKPLTLWMIRSLHARLMQGVRGKNKRPGQFRHCSVVIGRSGETPENARFVPPNPTSVEPLMFELEQYWKNPSPLAAIIQLAIIHYQFEAIHPFMDGNGRLGRLLIALLLAERQILPQPLLYLSAYFEMHGDEYRDLLLRVSQKGDWKAWIQFFAQGVLEQAQDAIQRSSTILQLWESYRNKAQRDGRPGKSLLLIDMLFESPALTVQRVEKRLSVAYTTAQRYIEVLISDGILVEATGFLRNRVYVAKEVLALLGDEQETDWRST